VVIERVELDHPYVDFADFGDEAGLLSVFASEEPKPKEPEKPHDSDFSPVAVLIDRLCIAEGKVALQPDDARQLLLQRLDGCVRISVGYNLSIGLDELRGELLNRGQRVLALVPRKELAPIADAAAAEGGDELARVGLAGKFSLREAMSFDAYL